LFHRVTSPAESLTTKKAVPPPPSAISVMVPLEIGWSRTGAAVPLVSQRPYSAGGTDVRLGGPPAKGGGLAALARDVATKPLRLLSRTGTVVVPSLVHSAGQILVGLPSSAEK